MSWVRLDDRMDENERIADLSPAAAWAHICAILYCSRNLTDGRLPLSQAKSLTLGKRAVVEELTRLRASSTEPGKMSALWEQAAGGYMIHDYLQYNPTRAKVVAEREAAKARKFGRSSGEPPLEHRVNEHQEFERSSLTPVDPVSPSSPLPVTPDTHHPIPVPTRAVVVGFEQCFARLLSPTELELVRALEEEHPKERIEFALREAAALNKRSVRYIQRTCERVANDQSSGADFGQSGKAANPNGGTVGTPGMDQRLAAQLQQRQHRTV